jgi:hypothetical protein
MQSKSYVTRGYYKGGCDKYIYVPRGYDSEGMWVVANSCTYLGKTLKGFMTETMTLIYEKRSLR